MSQALRLSQVQAVEDVEQVVLNEIVARATLDVICEIAGKLTVRERDAMIANRVRGYLEFLRATVTV